MDMNMSHMAQAIDRNAPRQELQLLAEMVFSDYAKTRHLYHPSEELMALVEQAQPVDGKVTPEMAADLLIAAHALTVQVGAGPVHFAIKKKAREAGVV